MHSRLAFALFLTALAAMTLIGPQACCLADDLPMMTHGPMLGRPTATSMTVWARTSKPSPFTVRFGTEPSKIDQAVEANVTKLADDNTGFVTLPDLKPSTNYWYEVYIAGFPQGHVGTFRTLPSTEESRHPEYNPKGLFNIRFEFGSCANQNPEHGIGHSLPLYQTMNRELVGDVDFAIMNGDWLYEEARATPPETWLAQYSLTPASAPKQVRDMPTIVGVWENYKLYMSRGVPLMQWHRQVPSYFTFDDHELINDIWGAGSPGRRDRRAVFRDIATEAWYDYLGWANPVDVDHPIHFGKATLRAGSDLLVDDEADFTKLPLKEMSNLHIHWGTATAGVNEMSLDTQAGDPNACVYNFVEVVSPTTLRLHMPAAATKRSSYSIGRRSYGKFRVSNCEYYLLDTRSHRQMHDTRDPAKKGLTMLGDEQRDWLMESMKSSDADFFFVVSSVPMMIPHSGAGGFEFDAANKEEAWVAFLDERETLIDFWDSLGKPVMVMTGDLHNSFAIEITDRVWEFCCGPHNSVNHVPKLDEADRPVTGKFQSGPRMVDIRWSSYILPDLERLDRCYPYYCVVQINNAFNMPQKLGGTRLVAFPDPQVILQYFEGRTGKMAYSETITGKRNAKPRE